jgi:methionyl aminopeptidase
MIELKSPREIEKMRAAGMLVARALARVREVVAPGVTTAHLDAAATRVVVAAGGEMAFLGYRVGKLAFPANICASVNEEVVHGIPGPRVLTAGDIVSVDVGVRLAGFYADAAVTLPVGPVDVGTERLLATTRECLERAVQAARPGRRLSDIARAVEGLAAGRGYGVVREYVGHGIGRLLHEEPRVPNFVSHELLANDVVLAEGMTLAIEPMVNAGTAGVKTLANGWTVVTRDGRWSAHFEHTVAVSADGPLVLTRPDDGARP